MFVLSMDFKFSGIDLSLELKIFESFAKDLGLFRALKSLRGQTVICMYLYLGARGH